MHTEAQARKLIIAACGTDPHGNYIARELQHDQTLENLALFSDRLAEMADRLKLFE